MTLASSPELNMENLFMDFLPVRTGSLDSLQSHSSRVYFELLSRSVLSSPLYWVTCDQVMKTDICTQVFSDSMNIHTHTNSCFFSFHSSWPSQCIPGVLLWHIAGTSNSCSLPFFSCTSHNANLSQVEVREILMFFLWLLSSRVSWYSGAWLLLHSWKIHFQVRKMRIVVRKNIARVASLFLPNAVKHESLRISAMLLCSTLTKSLFKFLQVTDYM